MQKKIFIIFQSSCIMTPPSKMQPEPNDPDTNSLLQQISAAVYYQFSNKH